MAFIEIDHDAFKSASDEMDSYIDYIKKEMSEGKNTIDELSSSWQGEDSSQFTAQWNTLYDNDSTYIKMIKSLEAYSDFLKYASKQYKNAQIKAVNRANTLPK